MWTYFEVARKIAFIPGEACGPHDSSPSRPTVRIGSPGPDARPNRTYLDGAEFCSSQQRGAFGDLRHNAYDGRAHLAYGSVCKGRRDDFRAAAGGSRAAGRESRRSDAYGQVHTLGEHLGGEGVAGAIEFEVPGRSAAAR